jgi:hypothetical protein
MSIRQFGSAEQMQKGKNTFDKSAKILDGKHTHTHNFCKTFDVSKFLENFLATTFRFADDLSSGHKHIHRHMFVLLCWPALSWAHQPSQPNNRCPFNLLTLADKWQIYAHFLSFLFLRLKRIRMSICPLRGGANEKRRWRQLSEMCVILWKLSLSCKFTSHIYYDYISSFIHGESWRMKSVLDAIKYCAELSANFSFPTYSM